MQDLFSHEAQTADRDRSLTTAIIDRAIDAGYSVRLQDDHGDNKTLTTRSRPNLLAAVGTSRATTFHIIDLRGPMAENIGNVTVYHGDSEDRVTGTEPRPDREAVITAICATPEQDAPTLIRITRRFMDDHAERDLPTPSAVRSTKQFHYIDATDPAALDLLSDAQHYAKDVDAGGEHAMLGLINSARATVKALTAGGVSATPILDEIAEYSDQITKATPTRSKGFPEWIDKTEARIANRVINAILNHEPALHARVWDGEELATGWTRHRPTLRNATAQTGFTILHIADKHGDKHRHIGSVTLIHGNGEDLVSDGGWSGEIEHAERTIETILAAGDPA